MPSIPDTSITLSFSIRLVVGDSGGLEWEVRQREIQIAAGGPSMLLTWGW